MEGNEMARNMKKDYILKIMKMEVPNGYKFDIANYLHNPSYSYDYPSFRKVIAEDEETLTVRRVYYFKHYDGKGEYIEEFFKEIKNGDSWQFVKEHKENILEKSNRFNINKLITFC